MLRTKCGCFSFFCNDMEDFESYTLSLTLSKDSSSTDHTVVEVQQNTTEVVLRKTKTKKSVLAVVRDFFRRCRRHLVAPTPLVIPDITITQPPEEDEEIHKDLLLESEVGCFLRGVYICVAAEQEQIQEEKARQAEVVGFLQEAYKDVGLVLGF